jgi:hypothetical protein
MMSSVVTDGLVGYWHYQQGVSGSTWENIAPDTKGQYDGQINGAVLQSDGIYFDGVDDYVELNTFATSSVYEFEFYLSYISDNLHPILVSDLSQIGLILDSIGDFFGTPSFVGSNLMFSPLALSKDVPYKINFIINLNYQTETLFVNNLEILGQVYNDPIILKNLSNGFNIAYFEGLFLHGKITSIKVYNKQLTTQERQQNSQVGTSIGLEDEPPIAEPPTPTIININKNTISDEPNMDRATVTFTFDQDVTEWRVRTIGTDHDTGILADSGGAVSAGTEITAEVDYTELYGEGQNRVNIYGKNADGQWTPYT